jgi:hypothetical protein
MCPSSTMVKHSTQSPKMEASYRATAAGREKRRKVLVWTMICWLSKTRVILRLSDTLQATHGFQNNVLWAFLSTSYQPLTINFTVFIKNLSWAPHACPTKFFIETLYKLHMSFLQNSLKLLTNFFQTSQEPIMYFLQTPY